MTNNNPTPPELSISNEILAPAAAGHVLPSITLTWDRFPNKPSANLAAALKKAMLFGIYGGKDAGKSALAETIASKYSKVIDVFGSRDNEALGWLRSPRKDSALLLKGASVKINSQWDSCNMADLTLKKISEYDVLISCASFYGDIREEWRGVLQLMNRLWRRTHYTEPWCLTMREAANLLYARVSIGETQAQAKNEAIYVLREMRHCGIALAADSIRWYAIDIDIRSLADYMFLKAQGIEGLPDSLGFLYSWYDPFWIMGMDRNQFVVMSRLGPLGHGTSTLPFWHKLEREDLLTQFDIDLEYGEIPDLGERRSHVGDYEHVRIVKIRIESKDSMARIAAKLGRSPTTIQKAIAHHNLMLEAVGECDMCARVNCKDSKTPLEDALRVNDPARRLLPPATEPAT